MRILEISCAIVHLHCYFIHVRPNQTSVLCVRQLGRGTDSTIWTAATHAAETRGWFFYTHWKLSRIPPSVLGNANHNKWEEHMRILSLFWNLLKKTCKFSLNAWWVWINTVACFCCSWRCCWFLSLRCRSWAQILSCPLRRRLLFLFKSHSNAVLWQSSTHIRRDFCTSGGGQWN